jgi:ubiquinone/menaquinone biosynthesis C-methylase UbiE
VSGYTPEQTWHLGNYQYPFYRFTLEKIVFKKKSKKILDAGCGPNGSSLSKFINGFFVGMDISKNNVKTSKAKYPNKDYVLASLTHLPFKEGFFDQIVCIDVIEHIEKKQQVFSELNRVLEPNGLFVGSTSNQLNPILFFDSRWPSLSEPLQQKFAPGHYERHQRVTPKSLGTCLKASGFKYEYRIFGFPLFNPWVYQYKNLRTPLHGYLWMVLDRLYSNSVLVFLKETLLWAATKPRKT